MPNRNSTVAALALIALLLPACHKSPTAPEPPAAPGGGTPVGVGASAKGGNGGGNGGSGTALVTMSGGMVGVAQEVNIQNDNTRELNVQGPYDNQVALSATHMAGSGACEIEPQGADKSLLFSKLVDGLQHRFRMVMVVDKRGSDHRLTLNFVDDDGTLENVILSVKDGPMVLEGPADTFEFSGGNVRLTDKRSIFKIKDRPKLSCPNLDTITVTLER